MNGHLYEVSLAKIDLSWWPKTTGFHHGCPGFPICSANNDMRSDWLYLYVVSEEYEPEAGVTAWWWHRWGAWAGGSPWSSYPVRSCSSAGRRPRAQSQCRHASTSTTSRYICVNWNDIKKKNTPRPVLQSNELPWPAEAWPLSHATQSRLFSSTQLHDMSITTPHYSAADDR